MSPEIRGRVAYYGPAHVERLKLIAQLQDRGPAHRRHPRSAREHRPGRARSRRVARRRAAGAGPLGQRPAAHGDRGGALRASPGPGARASSPTCCAATSSSGTATCTWCRARRCSTIAMKLEAAGIDLGTVAYAWEIVRKHVGRAANELVELFVKRVEDDKLAPGALELLRFAPPAGHGGRARSSSAGRWSTSSATSTSPGRMAKLQGRVTRGRKSQALDGLHPPGGSCLAVRRRGSGPRRPSPACCRTTRSGRRRCRRARTGARWP